jgi:hypothetical protein
MPKSEQCKADALLKPFRYSDDCDARRQRSPLSSLIASPTLMPYRSPVFADGFNSTQALQQRRHPAPHRNTSEPSALHGMNMPGLALIYVIFRG